MWNKLWAMKQSQQLGLQFTIWCNIKKINSYLTFYINRNKKCKITATAYINLVSFVTGSVSITVQLHHYEPIIMTDAAILDCSVGSHM